MSQSPAGINGIYYDIRIPFHAVFHIVKYVKSNNRRLEYKDTSKTDPLIKQSSVKELFNI